MAFFKYLDIVKADKELDRYKEERTAAILIDELGENSNERRIIKRSSILNSESGEVAKADKVRSKDSDRADS